MQPVIDISLTEKGNTFRKKLIETQSRKCTITHLRLPSIRVRNSRQWSHKRYRCRNSLGNRCVKLP